MANIESLRKSVRNTFRMALFILMLLCSAVWAQVTVQTNDPYYSINDPYGRMPLQNLDPYDEEKHARGCEYQCGVRPSICPLPLWTTTEAPGFLQSIWSSITSFRAADAMPSPIDNYPFMAAIRIIRNGCVIKVCSAMIVHEKIVISAAQCVFARRIEYYRCSNDSEEIKKAMSRPNKWERAFPNEIVITAGTSDYNATTPDQEYGVKEYVIHPDYQDLVPTNDIMILLLDRELPFSPNNPNVSSICVARNYRVRHGEYATFAGFGNSLNFTKYGHPETVVVHDSKLRDLTLMIDKREYCKRLNPLSLWEPLMCAGQKDRVLLSGDIGGPIFVSREYDFGVPYGRTYALGIDVSYPIEQNDPIPYFYLTGGNPAIFTLLGQHCCFIEYVTRNHVKCQDLPGSTDKTQCSYKFFEKDPALMLETTTEPQRKRRHLVPTEQQYDQLAQRVIAESKGHPTIATGPVQRGVKDAVNLMLDSVNRPQAVRAIRNVYERASQRLLLLSKTYPASIAYDHASNYYYVIQRFYEEVERMAREAEADSTHVVKRRV